jgi:GNAT superfamily N-acetyltransferase
LPEDALRLGGARIIDVAPRITIREALSAEAPQVLEMYEWLFEAPGYRPVQWDPARATAAIQETIDSPESVAFVAEDGARLVGLCTAYLDLLSVRYGLRCWVEDLVVAPDRRSEGLGARLLAAARRWAAERGATHLELDTGRARRDAQRFYDRQGEAHVGVSYSWALAPPRDPS